MGEGYSSRPFFCSLEAREGRPESDEQAKSKQEMKGEGRREKHTEELKRSFNWELALRVPGEGLAFNPKVWGSST